jgi:hypothetical protein
VQGQLRVLVDEGIEAVAQHRPRPVGHAREVHIRFERGFLIELEGTLTDVLSNVTDTFEISGDLQTGHNEAQVAGRRLVQCQEAGARLVHCDVEVIDHVVAFDHLARLG